MFVSRLTLTNFRCFAARQLHFEAPIVVLEGANGIGKTSILEALYYGCYMRSFRSHVQRELLFFGASHFFLEIAFRQSDEHLLQIGFGNGEKMVRLDGKAVDTYRTLLNTYRMVGLIEDDVQLIRGEPERRRAFLDQSLIVADQSYLEQWRAYRRILQQRNILLQHCAGILPRGSALEQLHVWSAQLWHQGREIAALRNRYISRLEQYVNEQLSEYFGQVEEGLSVRFSYASRAKPYQAEFSLFWDSYMQSGGIEREVRVGRSLFGIHLDDVDFLFCQRNVRTFGSRGQQKLIVFLLKIAQYRVLQELGLGGCLLLDDFVTDFDAKRLAGALRVLGGLTGGQVFLTTPVASILGTQLPLGAGVQHIILGNDPN